MKQYAAIDLKSFYASVECVERGLDPLRANLVVADESRTEKTICLAVSPPLKAYGISGRARLFEVVQRVREINVKRLQAAPGHVFTGKSCDAEALARDPSLELDYIIAPPRMRRYMQYSADIFRIYLKYVSPEDIHPYSIDEVFIDLTGYLRLRGVTAREMTMRMIRDVLHTTGVTATAGIGTNLYLCKIAMDIVAKKLPPDSDGVRIAELDERRYRELLWEHRPLTDFWRIGHGIAKKLESHGLYTMQDVARCSVGRETDFYNEELLYKLFGVNAELLIDHAWGWEPCTLAQIKAYQPRTSCLTSGQVLSRPYTAEKGRLVVREMCDQMALDLVRKGLVTDQLVLSVSYDVENLLDPVRRAAYRGEVITDVYGRSAPKYAHGTANLGGATSSARRMTEALSALYDRIVDSSLLVRRFGITANHVVRERTLTPEYEQLDLFSDHQAQEERRRREQRERNMQRAMLQIQYKYGKNAVVRGMNLQEGATAIERNGQVGGHRAE